MPNSPVPLGEIFAGKYRVDRILGEGGMGIVVAAHHLELDQTVAIKFLLDDLASNQEGAERFRREARAAAKIQSDHVVRVLDVGLLDTGVRYMVMEYLKGRDLSDELKDRGTLPVATAVTYILEALDAIGHAHAVGIVHRDLKPANLYLVERPDGSFRVKVLDFGISKTFGKTSASELSLTKTSAWIGSPLYMSPEQMQSARDVDHRADIWSLGAILYEMLTGQPPYLAETLPQLVNLLLTRDAAPLETLRPDLPPELGEVVMACLMRDPTLRVGSTDELAQALAPFAGPFASGRLSRLPAPAALDRTELGPTGGAGASPRASIPSHTPVLGSSGVGSSGVSAGARPGVTSETVSGHSASVPGGPLESGEKKKTTAWIVAAAAVVLVGGGIAFAVRPSSESEPLVAGPNTVTPEPAAVPEPAAAPAAVAPPVAAAPPAAAPATTEAPVEPKPAMVAADAKPTKPKPAVKPKPTTTSEPAKPSGDLSEFGGRR